MTDVSPPRPGYNRDGWKDGKPIAPVLEYNDPDPIIVNWPLVGRIVGVTFGLAGVFTPVSIILWRIAL